jgi:hypothetical protein
MMCALHRVSPAAEAVAPGTWRRHLAIALDGFRQTGSTTELTAPPMTADQMFRLAEQFQPAKSTDRSAVGHRES